MHTVKQKILHTYYNIICYYPMNVIIVIFDNLKIKILMCIYLTQ